MKKGTNQIRAFRRNESIFFLKQRPYPRWLFLFPIDGVIGYKQKSQAVILPMPHGLMKQSAFFRFRMQRMHVFVQRFFQKRT